MVKKKKIRTSVAWWEDFSHQLVLMDAKSLLSKPITEKYFSLSADHLYHLTSEVIRCVCCEFKNDYSPQNKKQLDFIDILPKIIEDGIVFDYKKGYSEYIYILSRMYGADVSMMKEILSDSRGPSGQLLSPPKQAGDYSMAVKEIVKETVVFLLRNFYNFLVTHPELNPIYQSMANKLHDILTRWKGDVIQKALPVKNNEIPPKQVSFRDPLVEFLVPLDNVNKENLPPPPKFLTWFKRLSS